MNLCSQFPRPASAGRGGTARLTRREFAIGGAATGLVAAFGFGARAERAGGTTLRFIARSDLRILDPIWSTAYVSRNHGYMVFDTLFALDSKFVPHPQMVGDYNVSPDRLMYRFALRDGLKFHDGQLVTGSDCIASLRRWMARDSLGQTLAAVIDDMTGDGDNNFTIRLNEPFPLLINALAKVSSPVPFIMPERLAKTDPFQQITEAVGSGPFQFVAEEFRPGHQVVYVKNANYVPRLEPPDWASGGKVVKTERVEWLYIPDHTTAVAALNSGEADWWEEVTPDLVPMLAANPDITVTRSDTLGSMSFLRFNHLNPPFDNVKMRQAVLAVADQADFMSSFVGDPKNWSRCLSFFTCGTPLASDAGSAPLTEQRDFDEARRLVAEAGYKGEKIVVLDGVDQPDTHMPAVVGYELLRKLGLNVELASSDWGTLVTRRASKRPIEEGGWSLFASDWVGADGIDPSVNPGLRGNGEAAPWVGWLTDKPLEELRTAWLKASDGAARKEIAGKIQTRAFEIVPYIPTGQWYPMTAYRNNLKDVVTGPALFMWNAKKLPA
jgi:peptide/nickel transport system substrate-binding protein